MQHKKSHKSRSQISITIVEATPMACQLLSDELLRSGKSFEVTSSAHTYEDALKEIAEVSPDIAVISSDLDNDPAVGFKIVRELRARASQTLPIMLLHSSAPDSVIRAFSAGAKGIVCRSESVEMLCKCIESVFAGQIWASAPQLQWVMSALAEKEPLRIVNAKGSPVLTKRAEQIVRMVAEGMPNSEIASELGVSPHTVKNHLFHIYEKLGISTRVELLLYALNNHNVSPA